MSKAFDPKKPISTKAGGKVRIIATDVKGQHPIIALHDMGTYEQAYMHSANGCYAGGNANTPQTLINTTVKRYRWLKLDDDGVIGASKELLSETEAKARYGDNLIMRMEGSLKEFDE